MNRFAITDPWIFFGVAGAVILYLIYMIIGRGKPDRSRPRDGEVEL